jgi:hypothetical protein
MGPPHCVSEVRREPLTDDGRELIISRAYCYAPISPCPGAGQDRRAFRLALILWSALPKRVRVEGRGNLAPMAARNGVSEFIGECWGAISTGRLDVPAAAREAATLDEASSARRFAVDWRSHVARALHRPGYRLEQSSRARMSGAANISPFGANSTIRPRDMMATRSQNRFGTDRNERLRGKSPKVEHLGTRALARTATTGSRGFSKGRLPSGVTRDRKWRDRSKKFRKGTRRYRDRGQIEGVYGKRNKDPDWNSGEACSLQLPWSLRSRQPWAAASAPCGRARRSSCGWLLGSGARR